MLPRMGLIYTSYLGLNQLPPLKSTPLAGIKSLRSIYRRQCPSIRGCVVDKRSMILEQLLPADGLWKHLPFQPELIGIVEIFRQIQFLSQDTLQAVIHGWKFRVLGSVIPAAIKSFNVRPQGTFFCLKIPRPSINVCVRQRRKRRQFRVLSLLPQNIIPAQHFHFVYKVDMWPLRLFCYLFVCF